MVIRAGYRVVEARWEEFGDRDFFEVEVLCGTLADAQKAAQEYLFKHVASSENELIWLQGVSNKQGQVYYANNKHITFRVRQ